MLLCIIVVFTCKNHEWPMILDEMFIKCEETRKVVCQTEKTDVIKSWTCKKVHDWICSNKLTSLKNILFDIIIDVHPWTILLQNVINVHLSLYRMNFIMKSKDYKNIYLWNYINIKKHIFVKHLL